MQECPYFRSCLYFAELFRARPAFARLYQGKYCVAKFQDCARFLVKKRMSLRPADQRLKPPVDPERDLLKAT